MHIWVFIRKVVPFLLVAFVLVQCASSPKYSNDAQGLYAQGEAALKDENYLIALEKFRSVKNRFPYSSRAVAAELRIADTYFAQESYIEAGAAYEIFREMHPTHKKIDYVQYRIGLSLFKQIPENSARDLTAAYRAVDEFNVLIGQYPASRYAKLAQEYKKKARTRLAEHENYVANFYFHRKHYLASSYRYASLIKRYMKLGYDELALYRLGVCYYHIQMYKRSRNALQRLVKEFPQSTYRGEAESMLQKLTRTSS